MNLGFCLGERRASNHFLSLLKSDTNFIKENKLVIIRNGIRHEFADLIVNEASVSTDLISSHSKDILLLNYEYSASFMKRKEIVQLTWTNNGLKYSKITYVLLDTRKEIEFSYTILLGGNSIPKDVTYENTLNISSRIEYTYLNKKNCKEEIKIFTSKNSFLEKVCSTKRIISSPAFYYDGTLIGNYLYKQEDYFSMMSSYTGNKPLEFKATKGVGLNIGSFNDIGYYLEQSGLFNESVALLTNVIEKSPDRAVAYINLGDAYWGLNNPPKAKEAYKKYIDLMKKSSKEAKIPKRVYDRIK